MSEHIRVERKGDVAVVHLDRPPANAMDPTLVEAGTKLLEKLAAEDPGAVVITGLPGFFSAGLDLKVAPTLSPEDGRAFVNGVNRVFAAAYRYPGPLVCAVTGHAVAGGLILALCGDYRVGSTEGKLGLTELRVGVPYPGVAMAVVRGELAPPAMRTLGLRAQLFDPPAALAMGLVDEVVEPDRVFERALEVAAELAALPTATYRLVKAQLRRDTLAEIERVLSSDGDPMLAAWSGDEMPAAAASVLGASAERKALLDKDAH
jgi:enoyl-CoA hydratase/carnithine racemase